MATRHSFKTLQKYCGETMSLPLSTIKTRLRTWIIASTSLAQGKVIFANQNAPKPEKPYITIDPCLNVKKVGMHDFEEHVNGQVISRPVRRVLVSLQAYGDGSIAYLSDCLETLDRTSVYEGFKADGISVVNRNTIQVKNITLVNDGVFIERATLDFEIDVVSSHTDSPGYAEEFSVELDVEYNLPTTNNQEVVTINVSVPESGNSYEPINPPFDIAFTPSYTSILITWDIE
jgi:hypothetical protein